MNTVQTNQDTDDGEYETIDSFQDPSSKPHVYDDVEFPPSSPSPPPPVPEYECVTTGTAVSASNKDFKITDCAAYSVTRRC